jgi:mono/diheme cytochrome c family protein
MSQDRRLGSDWTPQAPVLENGGSDQGGTLMLSRRLAVVVAPLVAALFAVVAPPSASAEEAATVFQKKCAPCHGKEGQPNKVFAKQGVRSFKDADWQKATDDAQIEKSIREGKKGTMMAGFASQLTDEEITALVAYIRKLGESS